MPEFESSRSLPDAGARDFDGARLTRRRLTGGALGEDAPNANETLNIGTNALPSNKLL